MKAAGQGRAGGRSKGRSRGRRPGSLKEEGYRDLALPAALVMAGAAAGLIGRLYFGPGPWRWLGTLTVWPLFFSLLRRGQLKRQRRKLQQETAGWLASCMMAVEAGSSIRQALERLSRELAGGRGKTGRAWRRLRDGLDLQLAVPAVLASLAAELDSPDLKSLSLALQASLEKGTDMIQVLRQGSADIRQSLAAEAEIGACLAQRRLEGTLMALAPFALVALLRLLAGDYMAPLFTGRGAPLMYLILLLQTAGGYGFFRLLEGREDGGGLLARAVFQQDLALGLKAGLIPEQAWGLACRLYEEKTAKAGPKADEFGRDLTAVDRALDLGFSFDRALKQAAWDREALRLTETLRENCRYGSGRLREILRAGAAESRSRQLLEIRSGGARRETWLLFPMIIMLISALCVTGGPALLELGAR